MPGWLTRATGALRGDAPEEPQPFALLCECGLRHTGLRKRRHQRIVCRSCGTSLFVLPRNCYPPPVAPSPPRKKRKRRRNSGPSTRDVPERAKPPVVLAAGKRLVSQAATNVAETSTAVSRGAADLGRSVGSHVTASALAGVRFWKPFRLIVAGILAIVLATVLFSSLSRSREQALGDLKLATERAEAAFAERNFPASNEHYARAVVALDRLQRDDLLARETRQWERETRVLCNLASFSLLELAAQADQALENGDGDEWQRTFELRNRHEWFTIEALVHSLRASGRTACVVGIPAAIGPHARVVELRIDGAPALDVLGIEGAGRNAVFAGQLESCRLSPDGRAWVLTLAPDTVFLWKNVESYQALGFTFDDRHLEDQVRVVLAAQARAAGLGSGPDAPETTAVSP
jgi:hypothetical protein